MTRVRAGFRGESTKAMSDYTTWGLETPERKGVLLTNYSYSTLLRGAE